MDKLNKEERNERNCALIYETTYIMIREKNVKSTNVLPKITEDEMKLSKFLALTHLFLLNMFFPI